MMNSRLARNLLIGTACVLMTIISGMVFLTQRELPPLAPRPQRTVAARPAAEAASRVELRPPSTGPENASADQFIGVILARQSLDVPAEVAGRLVAVHVAPGQEVRRNARLAVIDAGPLLQELELAMSGAQAARAEESKAITTLEIASLRRSRVGSANQWLSQEEMESYQQQERLAAADVAAAHAHVAESIARGNILRGTLARTSIQAPFDGVVTTLYQRVGAYVTPGVPVLRLLHKGDFRIRLAVPAERRNELHIGRRIVFKTGTFESIGSIEQISPEVEAASQMIFVEASLLMSEESSERIQAGLIGRASLLPAEEDDPSHGQGLAPAGSVPLPARASARP